MSKTEKTLTPYQIEANARRDFRAATNAGIKGNTVKLEARKSLVRACASLTFRSEFARLVAFVDKQGVKCPEAQAAAWADAVKTYVFKDEDEKGKAVFSPLPNKTAPTAAQVAAISAMANIVWKNERAAAAAVYEKANEAACEWADKGAEREAEAAKKREERKAKEIEKAKALLAENGLKVVA